MEFRITSPTRDVLFAAVLPYATLRFDQLLMQQCSLVRVSASRPRSDRSLSWEGRDVSKPAKPTSSRLDSGKQTALWDVTPCTDLRVVCLPPSSRLEVGLAGLLTSLWEGMVVHTPTSLYLPSYNTRSTPQLSDPQLLSATCMGLKCSIRETS